MHVRCINKEHSSGGIKSRAGIARVCVCARKKEERRGEERREGWKERKKERKEGKGKRLNEERKVEKR